MAHVQSRMWISRPKWSRLLAAKVAVAIVLPLALSSADADDAVFADGTRIVVAIRYLQPEGKSHSHLFLYSGDGTQMRQLSDASTGQDRDPIFSPDGKTVVFRREDRSKSNFWSVPTDGGQVQLLKEVPSWYFTALKEPLPIFTFPWQRSAIDPKDVYLSGSARAGEVHYRLPDITTEIVLKNKEDPNEEKSGFRKEPWLHEKDQADRRISDMPFTNFDASGSAEEHSIRAAEEFNDSYEFSSAPGVLEGVLVYQDSPFIWIPPMRLALLTQHRGSSFGNATFAVDLNTHTLHEIAPTSSDVFEIDDLPGLFCVTHERYLPLGDGKKTVNCSFLDLWNAQLRRTRFCAPKIAQFYGGCIWLPTKYRPETHFIAGEWE